MNCIERITRWRDRKPDHLAVWDFHTGSLTFGQLMALACNWQELLKRCGFATGDTVLLVGSANARCYAASLAVIGLGGRLMFVEPNLADASVDYAISVARPRFLITTAKSRLSPLSSESLTTIQHHLLLEAADNLGASDDLTVVDVAPDSCATITFTAGTQGRPKGVIRTHKYTLELVDLLTEGGCRDAYDEPDLTVFPAVGMLHLFSGRGTISISETASSKELNAAAKFAARALPRTLTANPTFLKKISDMQGFESLEAIYIGGSSADVSLVEYVCNRWPAAAVTHVFGCREAEPIALVDAREAIAKAKALGELKLRYLGEPLPFLKTLQTDKGLWVSGPNVSAEALIDPSRGITPTPDENTGYAWHLTGDRIEVRDDGWYWSGRASQSLDIFNLEQQAYQILGHTCAFVTENRFGAKLLFTENCPKDKGKVLAALPGIAGVVKSTMRYDKLRTDRIDRRATIRPSLKLKRWHLFLSERANLIGISMIAAGPAFGGFALNDKISNLILAILSFIFVAAGLVLARIMDECKDFEKDCVINPSRPLPRALLSATEMRLGVHTLTVVMTMIAFALAYLQATWAAIMGLGATLYLLLMEREFFVGERLAKSPIIYAFVHQLLIVPLYLLPLLAVPRNVELSPTLMAGFVVANLGGSMAYEISRKLSPSVATNAGTYLQVYGPRLTSYLLMACGIATAVGSASMHTISLGAPAAAVFLAIVIYWRRHPEKYRLVESASLLVGLTNLWALTIL
jgi:acyl-coenzyme A synthetase/AMP-(fatty) acid ligase/4-hydroxybenzoate polyprenyltransferase